MTIHVTGRNGIIKIVTLLSVIVASTIIGLHFYQLSRTPQVQEPTTTYESVDAKRAKEIIASKAQLTILDVRAREEYVAEHLNGAINIPLEELETRLDELDPSRPVLVYYRSGPGSAEAAQILARNGFTEVYDLEGGIPAWSAAGYETERERKEAPATSHQNTEVGKAFPLDEPFEDLEGRTLNIRDLNGDVVIVNFMMTRCGVCKKQISNLRELKDKLDVSITVVSISVDPAYDTVERLKAYKTEGCADWLWARDINDVGRESIGIHSFPTTLILDQNRDVAFMHEGAVDAFILEAEIEELVNSSSGCRCTQ